MIYISEMTVDAIGSPEPISADVGCARLTIVEKGQAGTTDYRIYNSTDSTGVGAYSQIPAGIPMPFSAGVSSNNRLAAGVVIAYVATVSGSKTFTKIHEF